jgi:DNA-binding LacI/PurR family transcriptional regulator
METLWSLSRHTRNPAVTGLGMIREPSAAPATLRVAGGASLPMPPYRLGRSQGRTPHETSAGGGDVQEGRVKRPTLEDVAALAGVSRASVSIVIRGAPGASAQTRQRVLQAATELGYRPDTRARLLARNRSQLLGVTFNVRHAFHADLLEGIYAAAEPAGYEVVLSAHTPSRDERNAVETLLDYRCEALILLGPEAPAQRLAEFGRRVPVVIVGRRIQEESVDVVRTADDEGMQQAVEHLVGLGHEEIVHVDGGQSPKATERRRGYRVAMRRHGLGGRIRILPGGQTEEAGVAAARRLLEWEVLPTAVVAYDDDCAYGLLDTFRRAGVAVPTDISVVGFDDSRLSHLLHINLTTVGQDARAMARLSVQRAVARLAADEVVDREVVLAPHLVVRGTTAAPPAPERLAAT